MKNGSKLTFVRNASFEIGYGDLEVLLGFLVNLLHQPICDYTKFFGYDKLESFVFWLTSELNWSKEHERRYRIEVNKKIESKWKSEEFYCERKLLRVEVTIRTRSEPGWILVITGKRKEYRFTVRWLDQRPHKPLRGLQSELWRIRQLGKSVNFKHCRGYV